MDKETTERLVSDAAHWKNLQPPLAPNLEEVSLYANLISGKSPVCLLGMTKELVQLCDVAVDLNPHNIDKPTICSDWNDLDGRFGAIIGDGILNLTGLEFANKMLDICDIFVCRVFMAKQNGMKYATFFPKEFPGCSNVIVTQPSIAMTVWTK